MRKIHLEMKALEWSRHYTLILRRTRAASSVVGGGVWPKCKLSQAFIAVIVTCKTEVDPFKNEGTTVVHVVSKTPATQTECRFNLKS